MIIQSLFKVYHLHLFSDHTMAVDVDGSLTLSYSSSVSGMEATDYKEDNWRVY